MNRAAGLLIALLVGGCSTQQSTLKPIYNSPKEIYAVPESEAFAMALQAIMSARPDYNKFDRVDIREMGGYFRGYEVTYEAWSFPRACFLERLYVIPAAGVAPNGRQTAGFRFVTTGAGWPLFRSTEQDTQLAGTLKAALDATGTITTITNWRVLPYDEGSLASNLPRRDFSAKPGFVFRSCPLHAG